MFLAYWWLRICHPALPCLQVADRRALATLDQTNPAYRPLRQAVALHEQIVQVELDEAAFQQKPEAGRRAHGTFTINALLGLEPGAVRVHGTKLGYTTRLDKDGGSRTAVMG